ncbi:MAG: hypothetical protein Fur002_11710 [Anaerolineales bacterium]
MSRVIRSNDFFWLALALFPLLAISFLLPAQPQDFWWLLRVGQETLQSGAIPVTDTISLSQSGQPIFYQTWLAGVLFYAARRIGGMTLVFLLRAALLALAYGALWNMLRRAALNPMLASALLILLGLASGNNWALRSQLFAYPLFAWSVWSVLRWQQGDDKALWAQPALMALWVNVHGSFILPFILMGLALLFGKGNKTALLQTLALTALATLLNPRGWEAWRYFAFMMRSPSDHLFAVEWQPPRNEGWQMNLFFAWTLSFAPLAAFSPRKLSALHWALFLAFGWLALSGTRYVIWFLFLLALFTAELLGAWAERFAPRPRNFPLVNFIMGCALLLSSLLFLHGIRERWLGDSVPVYERSTTPVESAAWLSAHPEVGGALWSDYAFGGYLAFALPDLKPWMDSRFNAYPPEQWEEYVRVSAAQGWREFFDREEISTLLLSRAAQSELIAAVEDSAAWQEQYRDPYAVIFTRIK